MPTAVIIDPSETPKRAAAIEYVAARIPGCVRIELDRGTMHIPANLERIRLEPRGVHRLRSVNEEAALDRRLATVLFTDIVGSTDKACEVGDARWKGCSAAQTLSYGPPRALPRQRGEDTGDGFLATFDGPARAVKCAQAICEAVKPLGLEVRAGCHTGEIELMGADVGGIAVHIGARVGALAGPSEVLVSSTVKDLVAGSGLVFEDRGEHELKGVPEPWHLYAALPPATA